MKAKQTLSTILFVAFLDNLSVGILLPLLPLLLTSHGSPISVLPSSLTEAQGYILFGYLLAIYTIAQFLSTPILGQLSDRYGRKPLLLASIIGTCFAYLLFGYGLVTKNLPLLFIARFFDGLTGGNISVAQAVIADITTPENRARAYGQFGAALGIGFALGPIIGAIFSNNAYVSWFNAATPFWVTAILAGVCALVIFFALPETFKPHIGAVKVNPFSPLKSLGRVMAHLNLRQLFSAIFVWRTGFGFWTTFGTVFLIYQFNLHQTQLGIYFFFVGLFLIISQLFLVPIANKRWPTEKILFTSIFGSAVIFFSYLFVRNWYILFFIIPFLASSTALTLATVPAVVSKAASSETQGEFSGLSNSLQSLALSIAPILSGYLSASLTPGIIVSISSLLMIAAGLVFWEYSRSAQRSAS